MYMIYICHMGLPGGAVVKNSPTSAGDKRGLGLIPEAGRFPGVGSDNLFQYSCLENSWDRGAWWAVVHGITELNMI